MQSIQSYSDYLIALRNQTSDLRYVRTEAINALENLRRSNPEKFAEYKARQEEAKKPKSAQERAHDKEKYIQEHPEINVKELRKKACAKMRINKYGFGLGMDIPVWMDEEEVINSVDQLSISDLITSSGKPVPRQTIIKKCVKIAIADGRIDHKKARQYIVSVYKSYCHNRNGYFKYYPPYSPSEIKEMIRMNATVQEVADIVSNNDMNYSKLFRLAKKKGLTELTAEDWEKIDEKKEIEEANLAQRIADFQAKKEARMARKKAKREALKAEQEALEKDQKTN